MSTLDLFADESPMGIEPIGPQSVVLRGHALPRAAPLLAAVDGVMAQAPLRHLVTPGGFTMSVAMTNCGALGWTSDRRGYRYSAIDPVSGQPWPAMPAVFAQLAGEAAAAAGFEGFAPDACLINQYLPGTRAATSLTLARPSSRCHWACRPHFCLEGLRARTRRPGCCCGMATWWSGAAWIGCATTACCRSRPSLTRCWEGDASISRFARRVEWRVRNGWAEQQ